MGLTKEVFEELQIAGLPVQYFCRKSFSTRDVLQPTKEQTAKLAESGIRKFFRLQPEYMGTRRIQVTECNVPVNLTGDVVASFLSSYKKEEEEIQLHAATGTAHGDFVFRICINRKGFQSTTDTIYSRDRQIIMVVEGRRPHCWNCKQHDHLAKSCPQKPPK